MFKKGVKPRTHLMIDLLLFALLIIVAFSALTTQLMAHTVEQDETGTRFIFHVIHEVAGIAMCLTVIVHLLTHLPWIRSQLSRLFKRQPVK